MQKLIPLLCICMLAVAPATSSTAKAQRIDIVRSGLIYALGRVNSVGGGSAKIDLGDIHTLRVGEKVAIIRPTDNYYVPMGVVTIAETHPTFCRASRAARVTPQPGDVAIFVREFSHLKPADQHRDSFIKQHYLKNSGNNQYSTFGRSDVAIALADYRSKYDRWERSKREVIGVLAGRSFAGGKEESIKTLLSQIDMMRAALRDGRNSLPAAGGQWPEVMAVLAGPTVTAQHQSAQKVVTDDEFVDEEVGGPTVRDIQRQVGETLFDRVDEEQKLISYLVATMLEANPPRLEAWFDLKLKRSQFPQLAEDLALIDDIRKILQKLRGEDA